MALRLWLAQPTGRVTGIQLGYTRTREGSERYNVLNVTKMSTKVTSGAAAAKPTVRVCVRSAVKVTEDGGTCSDRKTKPEKRWSLGGLCLGVCNEGVLKSNCRLLRASLGNVWLVSRLCCLTGLCKADEKKMWKLTLFEPNLQLLIQDKPKEVKTESV